MTISIIEKFTCLSLKHLLSSEPAEIDFHPFSPMHAFYPSFPLLIRNSEALEETQWI